MPNPPSPPAAPPAPEYAWGAAVLSYLVPGLGQIYQGRVGKGVLFLVCIYTLFFYGQRLGGGTVPYGDGTYTVSSNVYLPDPAILPRTQVLNFELNGVLKALYNRPQFLGQFWAGVASWPAVWQYLTCSKDRPSGESFLGNYQRTPPEEVVNQLQTDGDKTYELGWVFTVIAGVLNVMVIYDALAGPAFVARASREPETSHANAPVGAAP
ncbi:MAG TPA: DUF6677 family protein [Gemmataceae bacterium]|nr:DUF6677 family protein [Gemmataceae bacterium]